MKRFAFALTTVATAAIILFGICASSMAADKIKIEKLDDLPRYTYKIPMKAAEFIDNNEAAMKLAADLKKDLEADLAKYDIQDKTTLKEYYANLGTIALLKNQPDVYLDYLAKRKALEDKEPIKLTMGMVAQSYLAAKKAGGDFSAAFKADLKSRLEPLPYTDVESIIKSSKGGFEMMSKTLTIGGLEAGVQPIFDKSNGEASKDIAMGLVGATFSTRVMLPLKDDLVAVYTEYLNAKEAVKPVKKDIWAERDVALTDKDNAKPVVVGVWDSGVDADIFKTQMWNNAKEIAGNNKDDDNNGFVDDVNGIAFGLHSDKEVSLLFAIGDVAKDRPVLQKRMKGLEDLQANIDSPEAQDLKQMMATLPKDSVKPVFENIGKYGNYCHGTHVAGIAARENPFARLLACRITFDYHMMPELPTKELAQKEVIAATQAIDYFKKSNARVVNMSWGGSLASVEAALEANNAGGTNEERKKLSREIYEITKTGLFNAVKDAPEILFVISAGNSNSDVNFEEFYPSSFNLPNVLTVGAVDQAGEETSFSSFGKVDVYANGFEVESYVPGGDKMKLSGTSMSSPNVTNLAGKLFALKSSLTVAQAKGLIISGCDDRKAGERPMKLMNPKKSMELLAAMK